MSNILVFYEIVNKQLSNQSSPGAISHPLANPYNVSWGYVSILDGITTRVVWPNGKVVGYINEVALRRARLVLGWVTIRGYTVLVYSSHSGQLSLLPSVGCEMSTGQGAVAVL